MGNMHSDDSVRAVMSALWLLYKDVEELVVIDTAKSWDLTFVSTHEDWDLSMDPTVMSLRKVIVDNICSKAKVVVLSKIVQHVRVWWKQDKSEDHKDQARQCQEGLCEIRSRSTKHFSTALSGIRIVLNIKMKSF